MSITQIFNVYDSLLREAFSNAESLPEHWGLQAARGTSSHDFTVVHPKVRWDLSSASKLKDPQRQPDEAVTLVNILPGFRIVELTMMGADYNTKRKAVWGKVTALIINVDMLSPVQTFHQELKIFHVPIYDRYNIVHRYSSIMQRHKRLGCKFNLLKSHKSEAGYII
ncbi:unnamed protein product [Strongylus vulgaris]|uniref:Uncharacterized protein n=1 Tax=Strongylus vulgaris TaxID=40348 RepID=A0A3P7LM25_STRVU|nr:unnamed protein product [Strongylus vulgaris]